MDLAELKILLGIPPDDVSGDARLAILLEAGLDAAKSYIGDDWENFKNPITGVYELPALVRLGISKLVESADLGGVKSESIGGLSMTFDTNASTVIYQTYFNPFRRGGYGSFGFVAARDPFKTSGVSINAEPLKLGEE